MIFKVPSKPNHSMVLGYGLRESYREMPNIRIAGRWGHEQRALMKMPRAEVESDPG